jgi:hypothetical protein
MDPFTQSLQNWQISDATVAAAKATLTGLLFVSLSLHRDRLKGENTAYTLRIAHHTFGDFLVVLMICWAGTPGYTDHIMHRKDRSCLLKK